MTGIALLFLILAFLGIPYVWLFSLQNRIKKIEALSKGHISISRKEKTAGPLSSSTDSSEPTWLDRLADWAKEDWLLKLGALLILVGFSWFVTYAFLHHWVGPVGRIALGIIAGALILVFGWWRMRKYIHQGGIFIALGSTVILLTISAAREFYDFFTPASALFVIFLSTVFVALASVKYRTRSLALVSLILAGIAPLLVNAPVTNYVGLFSYLLVIIIGVVWIVAFTGWRILTVAALILVSFYSFPPFDSSLADPELLLFFAYAFSAIFFVTNTLGILKLKDKTIIPDLVTAVGNGLFLLAWILAAAQEEWKSLILSAWMVVFAMGSFFIFRMTNRKEPFFIYAGIGVVFLAAATSAELSGQMLTIAYTLEAATISLVAYAFLKDIHVAENLLLLFIVPIFLSLASLGSGTWLTGVFHKDFFVLFTLGVILLSLGIFYWFQKKKFQKRVEGVSSHLVLFIAGSFYAYALLWLSLRASMENRDTAIMISLAIYTVVGLIVYLLGGMRNIRKARLYGGALLALVILRLFTVDVWMMELTEKIITFFIVGALLISTAFIGRKHVSHFVVFLVLFGFFGPVAGAMDVLKPTMTEPTTEEVLSAFRQYRDINDLSITVPTVIEVALPDFVERDVFSVLDTTTHRLEPYFQSIHADDIPVSVTSDLFSQDADNMNDDDERTFSQYDVWQDGTGFVNIAITSKKPIFSSSLTVLLDDYVALPTFVEVRANTDRRDIVVVAKRKMTQQTIVFPKTSSDRWTVTFFYAQPLRITELILHQENSLADRSRFIRFLAQKGHNYRLYFDADRRPAMSSFGEVGDLAGALEFFSEPPSAPFPNPEYVIADIDKDTVPDVRDNCVTIFNMDQIDVNDNGLGDICDDFDRDGLMNSKDNCPDNPNYLQEDVDGDGIGDVCDDAESRITERLTWLPWLGIGFAASILIVLFALTARSMKKE